MDELQLVRDCFQEQQPSPEVTGIARDQLGAAMSASARGSNGRRARRVMIARLRPARRAPRPDLHPGRSSRLRRPGHPAGLARHAVPLAAAAAVVAIAVAAAVVMPTVWPGRDTTSSGRNAQPPPYYAAIVYKPHSNGTVLDIVDTRTGRVTGQLGSPRHGIYFQDVASLGSDRAFVAAAAVPEGPAIQRNCHTWLYRFWLTANGSPAGLIPFSEMPEVNGYPEFQGLAGSADGTTLAYTTDLNACRPHKPKRYGGQISVLHLRSGRTTRWPYLFPASPTPLSLSADGSLLGFVSNPSDGARSGGPATADTWVLPTDSPAGPLQRYYHRVTVPRPPGAQESWPSAVVLSHSGRTMLTAIDDPGGNTRLMALRDYQTRTGRLTRTVRVLRPHGTYDSNPGLTPSISGRYVLIYLWNKQVSRLDLATGRLIPLRRPTHMPVVAAW